MATSSRNLFLSSLSRRGRALLEEHCTPVPLPARTVLARAEEAPPFAYFITSGLASLLAAMPDGAAVEVGMHGDEGVVGAIQILGPTTNSMLCLMQIEGSGLRMPTKELAKIFQFSEEIRNRLLSRVQVDILILGQIAACNRLHGSKERLARWLLMAQDRVHSNVLGLTQEFLADMLGGRRSTVTAVAGILHQSGLIDYHRGRVTIANRKGLEDAACDCYRVIRDFAAA